MKISTPVIILIDGVLGSRTSNLKLAPSVEGSPLQKLSPEYGKPIVGNLVLQAICAVVASSLLDGGAVLRPAIFAIITYWAGVAMIALRRPRSPTRMDVLFLNGGFIFLFALIWQLLWLVQKFVWLR